MIRELSLCSIYLTILCCAGVFCQITDTKNTYRLKCFSSQQDCTIIKVDSQSNEIDSVDGLEDELSKRNINPLHNFMKKYFNVEHPDAFKADVVNCMSETLCTAKIERKRGRGSSNLACIGNPYSGSGSRCLPLEGLYIGK